MFKPKIFDTLENYSWFQFRKDLMAGLIVGIVALPLAIAFAIASGVSPERGLYTAIIAGFMISALGGSRVQIGGPTGAFIVIVLDIVQKHSVSGLIIATFIAGVMLLILGFAKVGSVIKFIPHPLIVGFTSGIALIIFSSQVKDFFGLDAGDIPSDLLDKWKVYFQHFSSLKYSSTIIAVSTVLVVVFWSKLTHKIPGSLVAIVITTAAAHFLHLPVETIGSRFGDIPSSLPAPGFPQVDFATIKNLIQPAFTIALLCAIESLLSAVVADGMIGGNHRSNMELVAQGVANISSSLFGGIPATGAIARTATNVKSGGRTPVAGIVHSLVLLIIMLFVGQWAALIPLATLAGILVVVAFNMSEWKSFVSVIKGPRSDAAVLLTTFLLTVFIDLTVAIEIGMVLAAFLFMRKMIKVSGVTMLTNEIEDEVNSSEKDAATNYIIPAHVQVFEIRGPLFFGAIYKFRDAMKIVDKRPRVLIIRMSQVPIIDATGIKTIEELLHETRQSGTKLILSEVHSQQVLHAMGDARLLFAIGKANVCTTLAKAIDRANTVLNES